MYEEAYYEVAGELREVERDRDRLQEENTNLREELDAVKKANFLVCQEATDQKKRADRAEAERDEHKQRWNTQKETIKAMEGCKADHLSATYFKGLVDAGMEVLDAKLKMHAYTKKIRKEDEK